MSAKFQRLEVPKKMWLTQFELCSVMWVAYVASCSPLNQCKIGFKISNSGLKESKYVSPNMNTFFILSWSSAQKSEKSETNSSTFIRKWTRYRSENNYFPILNWHTNSSDFDTDSRCTCMGHSWDNMCQPTPPPYLANLLDLSWWKNKYTGIDSFTRKGSCKIWWMLFICPC